MFCEPEQTFQFSVLVTAWFRVQLKMKLTSGTKVCHNFSSPLDRKNLAS